MRHIERQEKSYTDGSGEDLRIFILSKINHIAKDVSSGANVPADEGLLDGLDLDAADMLGGNGTLNSEGDASFLDGANGKNRSVGTRTEGDNGEVAAALLRKRLEALGEAVLDDEAEDVTDVEGSRSLLV